MEVIRIAHQAVERIGRNDFGNLYKYRWVVYCRSEDSSPYGTFIRHQGKDVKVDEAFVGTKREVRAWLKDNGIYDKYAAMLA